MCHLIDARALHNLVPQHPVRLLCGGLGTAVVHIAPCPFEGQYAIEIAACRRRFGHRFEFGDRLGGRPRPRGGNALLDLGFERLPAPRLWRIAGVRRQLPGVRQDTDHGR